MSSSFDDQSKGNPTIQDIERWDATKLAKWIQQVFDPPLSSKQRKIIDAEIDGPVFRGMRAITTSFEMPAYHPGPVMISPTWRRT